MCSHPDYGDNVEQRIYPVYCGRKSACSFTHYVKARDDHGFIYPGFISPGDTCVVLLAHNVTLPLPVTEPKCKRKSPSAKAPSSMALPSAAAERDDDID